MTHARALLLVFFIAIMAWLWYPYLNSNIVASKPENELLVTPDYIAMDLQQSAYNKIGKLSHSVKAQKVEMYQGLGFSHFQYPIFTIYNQQQSWQLTANEATLYENNTLILEGNVVATNQGEASMVEKITAAHIRVDINNKTLLSEQPVVISGPNLTITGKGLHADLNTDIIELNNHTRTTYYDQ
ncbi:LPS export ABC transporter periplasmic protein LptC [Pseudoalteromonas fenneropenaei]|uniref:Lipopolysaccharide export system protein LptC n=1 Tax=Pseudoalteromonas fenneropenaei TaxID=1737459 RepID=A0ABV7CK44_9GAMM